MKYPKNPTHTILTNVISVAFAALTLHADTPVSNTTQTETEWVLVWSDEFDDPQLDLSVWNIEVNDFGGYNNELQYYSDRPENIRLEEGQLVITARQEVYQKRNYTSARINSHGKKSVCYGRIEARMKLVDGTGMWPAFWMMGNSGKWPENGEIDIMELVAGDGCADCGDNRSWGTLWHTNEKGVNQSHPMEAPRLEEGKYSDDYHLFGIEWNPTSITWFIDDKPFHQVDITGETFAPFHKPFYFLINLAVGGDWPGTPSTETVFPKEMRVDYLRVYKRK